MRPSFTSCSTASCTAKVLFLVAVSLVGHDRASRSQVLISHQRLKSPQWESFVPNGGSQGSNSCSADSRIQYGLCCGGLIEVEGHQDTQRHACNLCLAWCMANVQFAQCWVQRQGNIIGDIVNQQLLS